MMPSDVEGPFVVIPLTPVVNVIKNATAASTLYTTPTNKDFYLTSASISMAKAVGDTGTVASITVFVDSPGSAQNLISLAGITLTAERDSIAVNYNPPIKIDRGTVIAFNTSGTFSSTRAHITGYEDR